MNQSNEHEKVEWDTEAAIERDEDECPNVSESWVRTPGLHRGLDLSGGLTVMAAGQAGRRVPSPGTRSSFQSEREISALDRRWRLFRSAELHSDVSQIYNLRDAREGHVRGGSMFCRVQLGDTAD